MLSHMQAKGLSAGYNGEAVFKGLDLKIPEGSITTLIGSNGSGKSTILKTLCRIISPDSGADIELYIYGHFSVGLVFISFI